MTKEANVQPISMANTKKDMLQAYTELKKLLELKNRDLLDAEKIRAEQDRRQTAAAATEAVATDPIERIGELRRTLGAELTGLADRFATEHDRYRTLCTEIEHKKDDLERIFGVETAAVDLAALLQAQESERDRFNAEMAAQKVELEAEITAHKTQWKDEAAQFEQKRKRDREEHEYGWKRELSRKQTELRDKLADLTSQLQAKQAAFDEQVGTRQRELTAREEAVAEREQTMDELRARVEAFPAERDEAVTRAIDETSGRLHAEHDLTQRLQTKEFEGQIHVLESRIESLTELVASQVTQIEALTGQQEKAYEKVQDIASKAVAGAARTIITGPAAERGGSRRGEDERE